MGHDLVAKRPRRGAAGHYRSGIPFMTFLRSAMVAAGVKEAIAYTKFVPNDGHLVTSVQSRMIAEQLATWVQGRNLTLDLAETNERARASTEGLFQILQALSSQKEKVQKARIRRAKSLPFRVHRKARTAIRTFAAFCAGSGGFRVW